MGVNGISLTKGQKISLTKDHPNLRNVLVGLGWDANPFDGYDFDLDASAFMCGRNGKCPSTNEFIFYNQLEHCSGAVIHMGDNRTGDGDGDDEQILLDLSKMPINIDKVEFAVTIDQAEQRRQCFGQVDNAYIRIIDQDTDMELCRFDLTEKFSTETAIVAGGIYRKDGEWRFNAIGSGFQGGLAALCQRYNIPIKE